MVRIVPTLVTTVAALMLWAAPVRAQVFSQFFDPSIEAAGMGGASIATFWQENPNDHANPALMGFHRGLRYSYGTTRLLPEATGADVHYTSHRILAGAWGVGVAMTGKPIESLGRLRLNYGESQITDIDGNVIGVYEPHEDVRSIAVGLSVFDLISSIRVAKGGEPLGLSRRVSLALGHAWKTYDLDFAPVELVPNGHGEGTNNDAGILLRIAPYDQIGGGLSEASDHVRFRVEVAGAYTRTDYLNDHDIEYGGFGSDELFEQRSVGGSALFTLALPSDGLGAFRNFATPAIRLGVTYEHVDVYEEGVKQGELSNRYGTELSVLDMAYLRYGHVDGDLYGNDDATFGAGLSLKYRNMIGVKGDYARYPQATIEDEHLDRWGITVFVDPYRLMKKGAD